MLKNMEIFTSTGNEDSTAVDKSFGVSTFDTPLLTAFKNPLNFPHLTFKIRFKKCLKLHTSAVRRGFYYRDHHRHHSLSSKDITLGREVEREMGYCERKAILSSVKKWKDEVLSSPWQNAIRININDATNTIRRHQDEMLNDISLNKAYQHSSECHNKRVHISIFFHRYQSILCVWW